MPLSFDPARHPRDKRGRFTKSKTVLASAKDKKAVKEITAGFKPAKTGDGKSYAGKIADPGHQNVARDFALDAKAINEDLRAGHTDAQGVKPMDDAMRPLPDDLVLHRSVPATAFGGIDPQSLAGMKVRDAGFSPTQIDAPQASDGDVHMLIAAPKGSRAVVNAETGEVYLDRDSEMVVSRVEPNSAGGHDMYLTVLPKGGAKDDSTKPAKVEPASTKSTGAEPHKPAGGDEFRASLMKQKVPELQAQMRERGLKPGKKRKSELVDALVADETGHDGKADKPAGSPDTVKPAAAPTSRENVEDRVRSVLDELIARDGGRPETLISLARLRDELDDLPRSDLDAALLRLDRQRIVQLEPDPNRQALTDRARAAAIPLGGEDMHLVTVLKHKPPADRTGDPAGFESRLASAAKGEDALRSAPLSLTRPDTYAKPGDERGLTADQRYALIDYQGSEYAKINGRLRALANGEKDTSTRGTAEMTGYLDEAMAASPLGSDAVVYRGIRASRKVFGDRIDADLTGMQWLETGFVSTSAVEAQTEHFSGFRTDPVRMRILAPKGTNAIQVSEVQDSGGVADEAELLLDRNTRMRVVADRGVVDGVRHLDVEVVT